MLGRRSREFPSHHTEAPALAAKATDLDASKTALADALAAERIAAGTAEALRAELDRLRTRPPWWRRWFRRA